MPEISKSIDKNNEKNKKLDFTKLEYKELVNFLEKSTYYYKNKKTDFKSLPDNLPILIKVVAYGPIHIFKKTRIPILFEKYIQEQTGFEQDITSKNFSKEALHKYFIGFLNKEREGKQNFLEKLFNRDLVEGKIVYNGQEYNMADIIFENLYPDIVDYRIVNKEIKKNINDLGKEMEK